MTQAPAPGDRFGPGLSQKEDFRSLVDRVRLLYQPLVNLSLLELDGVEVLARVLRPDGSLAGPDSVLEAMDSAAASMALTREILFRGLNEYAAYKIGDRTNLNFVFNLPLDAMLHPQLIEMIETVRADHLPAERLGFELTERHPVENVEQLSRIIDRLTSAGYKVSLDDITPATPHLAELLKLPFQTVKLDRSVVLDAGEEAVAYIRMVVESTSARGQHVVAEGIETRDVLERMRSLGVSHGQGYLFARPMAADALPAFLAKFTADAVQ